MGTRFLAYNQVCSHYAMNAVTTILLLALVRVWHCLNVLYCLGQLHKNVTLSNFLSISGVILPLYSQVSQMRHRLPSIIFLIIYNVQSTIMCCLNSLRSQLRQWTFPPTPFQTQMCLSQSVPRGQYALNSVTRREENSEQSKCKNTVSLRTAGT